MPKTHGRLHKFSAGMNTLQNTAPLPFDHPVQADWKVYYEGLTNGATLTDDAYWLIQANGGGTIGAGDSNSIRITGDGTVFSGYSLYKKLADVRLAAASKKFYLETSLKVTAGSVPDNAIFVGYTSANEAMTTGTVNDIDGGDEALGFGMVTQDTAIKFYSREDATTQTISFGYPLVTATYTKLQCYYDGVNFNLYRDDEFISSTVRTQLNADEAMTPQVFYEAVDAAANTLDVRYLLLAVEL